MAVASGTFQRLARSVALVAALSVAGQVQALAPEHEMRRLMLATEEAVNAGSWGEAGEYLNRLQQLEAEKPAEYFFYRGRVMLQAGHLNEAQAALEAYVTKAGTEGSEYQQALKLITDVERTRKSGSADQANGKQPPKVAVIEPAGDQRLSSLKKLYLTNNDRDALLMHLNSLLDMAGWRADQTVVRLDKPADVAYEVSATESVISFQEIRREEGSRLVRKTQTMEVYGVNPMIEWGCEAAVASCWIYDPRDGSRLMQLGYNRERAGEIAQTLGQLVRHLQAPAGS
ncbi:hypothetical protein DET50_11740 [Marinobacter pelagius]|uniref:Tetratricopeptide repeat protein n=1 Tax=Marinobacter pelagius TaxID=379482 RepID=A0A366GHY6_9GAMM|nr:hypothetical protein [Marinobacter pelagius]RBP26549.1 hypothetical protein DET50_11740 [Marinobacter pelagius]